MTKGKHRRNASSPDNLQKQIAATKNITFENYLRNLESVVNSGSSGSEKRPSRGSSNVERFFAAKKKSPWRRTSAGNSKQNSPKSIRVSRASQILGGAMSSNL